MRLRTSATPSSSFKAGRRIDRLARAGFTTSPQGTSGAGSGGSGESENGPMEGARGARAPTDPPDNGHSSAGCPIRRFPSTNFLIPYDRPGEHRPRDRAPESERDLDVACELASASWEAGPSIRSAPPRTLLFTALDLCRHSVAGMLSDFWHTFCRGASRRDRTMAGDKTPFLHVAIADVRGKRANGGTRDRTADVAPLLSVTQGYLFEGADQWVRPPWEGEGSVWAGSHYPRWKTPPFRSCPRSTRKAVSTRCSSYEGPGRSSPPGREREFAWPSHARC